MSHETVSLALALITLGLYYLGFAFGPAAKRHRQHSNKLPVPDPYPPSSFPDRVHQWIGLLFVSFFFIACFTPASSGETDAVAEDVPAMVEAVQTEKPEALPADQPQQFPPAETSDSVHVEDAEEVPPTPYHAELPPTETTNEEAQANNQIFFLEDTLFSLLLYSPLFVLFCSVPNANRSNTPLSRKIQLIFYYLALAYLLSLLYNLTGLPTLLMEWTQAPELQQISQDVQSINDPLTLLGASISIVIVTPICEEICFRGFIFNTLVRDWGMPIAATISGLLFGAIHFSLLHFIPLSILGILLAVSYYRSRTIWTPIIIHGLFNAIGITALVTSA